jgi:hypothetical protein
MPNDLLSDKRMHNCVLFNTPILTAVKTNWVDGVGEDCGRIGREVEIRKGQFLPKHQIEANQINAAVQFKSPSRPKCCTRRDGANTCGEVAHINTTL